MIKLIYKNMYPNVKGSESGVENTEGVSTIFWNRITNAEEDLNAQKLEYAQYLLDSGANDTRFLATYPDMAKWTEDQKTKKFATKQ